MDCAGCGHALSLHGRRGRGACRSRDWSDTGRAEAERIAAEGKAVGRSPIVTLEVLRTLQALPGAHVDCTCKRFRKTPAEEATPNS